jgi:hypothetical protein
MPMDLQFTGEMLAGVIWNSAIPAIFGYLGGVVLLSSLLLPLFWPNWKEWSSKMMKSEKARRWMKRGVIVSGIVLIFIGLIISASNIYENKTSQQQKIIDVLNGNVTSLNNQVQLLNNELVMAKQQSFALPSELLASHLTGLRIRITDMTIDSGTIQDKIFDDCTFFGPAVIQIHDPMKQSTDIVFELEHGASVDSLFISSTNDSYTGVIIFQNCIFNNCHFVHIGYIAKPDIIATLKSQTTINISGD